MLNIRSECWAWSLTDLENSRNSEDIRRCFNFRNTPIRRGEPDYNSIFKWSFKSSCVQFQWYSLVFFLFLLFFYFYLQVYMMNCLIWGLVDWRKAFTPHFQPESLSEILTIANIWQAARRIWTCAESEFRLCWMKLCSSDNHYATAPKNRNTLFVLIKNYDFRFYFWY